MLQRLTERPFYGVSKLLGLSIRKILSVYCQAAAEELFREDRVNELHREVTPLRSLVIPDVLEVQELPSDEVRMVPSPPTATNFTDSVLLPVLLDTEVSISS